MAQSRRRAGGEAPGVARGSDSEGRAATASAARRARDRGRRAAFRRSGSAQRPFALPAARPPNEDAGDPNDDLGEPGDGPGEDPPAGGPVRDPPPVEPPPSEPPPGELPPNVGPPVLEAVPSPSPPYRPSAHGSPAPGPASSPPSRARRDSKPMPNHVQLSGLGSSAAGAGAGGSGCGGGLRPGGDTAGGAASAVPARPNSSRRAINVLIMAAPESGGRDTQRRPPLFPILAPLPDPPGIPVPCDDRGWNCSCWRCWFWN